MANEASLLIIKRLILLNIKWMFKKNHQVLILSAINKCMLHETLNWKLIAQKSKIFSAVVIIIFYFLFYICISSLITELLK